jgi:hypothetical protein
MKFIHHIELVTVAELAQMTGLTIFSIHYHCRQKHLTFNKIGRQYLFSPSVAQEFLAKYKAGEFKRGPKARVKL